MVAPIDRADCCESCANGFHFDPAPVACGCPCHGQAQRFWTRAHGPELRPQPPPCERPRIPWYWWAVPLALGLAFAGALLWDALATAWRGL